MRRTQLGVCVLIGVLLAFGVGVCGQKTLTVPDDYPTIQAAIDAASPGDKVFVRAGTYTENLMITKPLRLLGEGRLAVRVRAADPEASVVDVRLDAGEVEISSLSVSDGEDGLAIQVEEGASVLLCDVLAVDNGCGTSARGAGTVRIADSYLVDNGVGLSTSVGAMQVVATEITGAGASRSARYGILIEGSGHTRIETNLIGAMPFGVLAHQPGCEAGGIWREAFEGTVEGHGNRVYGTSTDLCPTYPGVPWPLEFVDKTWREAIGVVMGHYGSAMHAYGQQKWQDAIDECEAALERLVSSQFPFYEAEIRRTVAIAYLHSGSMARRLSTSISRGTNTSNAR